MMMVDHWGLVFATRSIAYFYYIFNLGCEKYLHDIISNVYTTGALYFLQAILYISFNYQLISNCDDYCGVLGILKLDIIANMDSILNLGTLLLDLLPHILGIFLLDLVATKDSL